MKNKYLVVLNYKEDCIDLFKVDACITKKEIQDLLEDVFGKDGIGMYYQLIDRRGLSRFATQCISELV